MSEFLFRAMPAFFSPRKNASLIHMQFQRLVFDQILNSTPSWKTRDLGGHVMGTRIVRQNFEISEFLFRVSLHVAPRERMHASCTLHMLQITNFLIFRYPNLDSPMMRHCALQTA